MYRGPNGELLGTHKEGDVYVVADRRCVPPKRYRHSMLPACESRGKCADNLHNYGKAMNLDYVSQAAPPSNPNEGMMPPLHGIAGSDPLTGQQWIQVRAQGPSILRTYVPGVGWIDAFGGVFDPNNPDAPMRTYPLSMSLIMSEIRAERERQDQIHGGPAHDDANDEADWVLFIRNHAREAEAEFSHSKKGLADYRRRLVQTAALAVAAIQALERNIAAGKYNAD
jgi:hypothetical protein